MPHTTASIDTSTSLREVGHLASWSVTSAKLGNGVDCLRDEKTDTFWQ
jgi:anaphase-promoting complex subunit 10